MATITIWHNNRCGKSREGVKYLEEKGLDFEIRKYLDNPPSKEELQEVLNKLEMKPSQLVRKKEAIFKELNLKDADEETILEAMVKHPKLIERPIVIKGEKAVVARPKELIDSIL